MNQTCQIVIIMKTVSSFLCLKMYMGHLEMFHLHLRKYHVNLSIFVLFRVVLCVYLIFVDYRTYKNLIPLLTSH